MTSTRNVYPGPLTPTKETIKIMGSVTLDGTGAVDSFSIPGVSAVAQGTPNDGDYKLSLEDSYAGGLVGVSINCMGGYLGEISNDSSTDQDDPHVDLFFRSISTGLAADPDDETFYVELTFARRV